MNLRPFKQSISFLYSGFAVLCRELDVSHTCGSKVTNILATGTTDNTQNGNGTL